MGVTTEQKICCPEKTLKTPDYRIEVVAGILWREGQYLAAQRPKHVPLGGFWEFPGGKVEEGESLDAALLRELWEELSIKVQKSCYWKTVEHDYPQRKVRVHFFHVLNFEGEPRGAEGQHLAWTTPESGLSMNFLEADTALVQALVSESFS